MSEVPDFGIFGRDVEQVKGVKPNGGERTLYKFGSLLLRKFSRRDMEVHLKGVVPENAPLADFKEACVSLLDSLHAAGISHDIQVSTIYAEEKGVTGSEVGLTFSCGDLRSVSRKFEELSFEESQKYIKKFRHLAQKMLFYGIGRFLRHAPVPWDMPNLAQFVFAPLHSNAESDFVLVDTDPYFLNSREGYTVYFKNLSYCIQHSQMHFKRFSVLSRYDEEVLEILQKSAEDILNDLRLNKKPKSSNASSSKERKQKLFFGAKI